MTLGIGILLAAMAASATAQTTEAAPQQNAGTQGERRGQGGGRMMFGGGNMGTITAIDGANITIKTAEGNSLTVKTTADTRFIGSDRTPIELKGLKVGDTVMAGGRTVADAVEARMVVQLDAEMTKRIADQRAAMGKTIIVGEIKEINETRLTILRPDGQIQVADLDENTSLKKGQESVTLADVKVGDRAYGTGEVKGGVFMLKELRVGNGMEFRRHDVAESAPDRSKPVPPKQEPPKQEPPKL